MKDSSNAETCIRVVNGIPVVCKKPPGRPRKKPREQLNCAYSPCGKTFESLVRQEEKLRFCSGRCHLAFERERRWNVEFARKRKQRYKAKEILDLYTKKGLSTVKIAKIVHASDPQIVRSILLRSGAEIRHAKDYSAQTCRIKGCDRPVQKIHHATNGCNYGTRCAEHLKQHRKSVCKISAQKFRASHPGELARRCRLWAEKYRTMTFDELYQIVKENPCQFRKQELLRKLRKLNRQGKSREVISKALLAFPMNPPKQE